MDIWVQRMNESVAKMSSDKKLDLENAGISTQPVISSVYLLSTLPEPLKSWDCKTSY